jgi:hypothetical protein
VERFLAEFQISCFDIWMLSALPAFMRGPCRVINFLPSESAIPVRPSDYITTLRSRSNKYTSNELVGCCGAATLNRHMQTTNAAAKSVQSRQSPTRKLHDGFCLISTIHGPGRRQLTELANSEGTTSVTSANRIREKDLTLHGGTVNRSLQTHCAKPPQPPEWLSRVA